MSTLTKLTGKYSYLPLKMSAILEYAHFILTTLNRHYNFQNVLFLYKNYIKTSKSCIFIILEGIIPHTGGFW
jgi:hypothetical protein